MENLNYLTLGAAAGGSSTIFLVFIVIMFVGMYFISIRPQKKQQQKRQEMLNQMSKGDKVVTLGGIKGSIASIDRDNKEVVVDCDGIYLTFDLNFIRKATPGDKVKASDGKNKPEAKVEEKTEEAPKEEAKPEEKTEEKSDDVAKDDAKADDATESTEKAESDDTTEEK